jgi:hypothetical protein
MNFLVTRLQDYLRLARTQSTIEISNPAKGAGPAFADQDEWELQQGMLLDNEKIAQRDELIGEYRDKMLELEGDDEAWVHSSGPDCGALAGADHCPSGCLSSQGKIMSEKSVVPTSESQNQVLFAAIKSEPSCRWHSKCNHSRRFFLPMP